jgi:hypothetical protein
MDENLYGTSNSFRTDKETISKSLDKIIHNLVEYGIIKI